jgi:excinuclease UvrABC ATPase subunit
MLHEIERMIQANESSKTAAEAEQSLAASTFNRYQALLERKSVSQQEFDEIQARYRGKTDCPQCLGTRLKKEASYVKVHHKSIQELVLVPVIELFKFISNLRLNDYEQKVAGRTGGIEEDHS